MLDALGAIGQGLLVLPAALLVGVAFLGAMAYEGLKRLFFPSSSDDPFIDSVVNDVSNIPIIGGLVDPVLQGLAPFVGLVAGWKDAEDSSWNTPSEVEVDVPMGKNIPAEQAEANRTSANQLSPARRLRFAYLDVGRWGGDADHSGDTDGVSFKRDFGVVCGMTAALCMFVPTAKLPSGQSRISTVPLPVGHPLQQWSPPPGGPAQPLPVAQRSAEEQEELANINAVLAVLNFDGRVHVRRCLRSQTDLRAVPADSQPKRDVVYVIMGDTHMPVTTPMETDSQPQNLSPDTTQVTLAPNRRYERRPLGRFLTGGFDLGQWLGFYDGTDAFRGAGVDLLAFMTALKNYNLNPGASTPHPTAHYMQLGDMIDLWIGFQCFFQGNGTDDTRALGTGILIPRNSPLETDFPWQDFIQDWTTNVFYYSRHKDALQAIANFGESTFCWGNHDCYYGITSPSVLGGTRVREHVIGAQLYAEHGHRWDAHNTDGISDASGKGWALSQIAVTHPSARLVEPQSRGDQLTGAAQLFYSTQGNPHFPRRLPANLPFAIYTMGHTHVGVLCEIVLKVKYTTGDPIPDNPPPPAATGASGPARTDDAPPSSDPADSPAPASTPGGGSGPSGPGAPGGTPNPTAIA